MSRREIIECDRCGSIGDEHTERDFRGRVYAATLSGRDRIGSSEMPADLCARCMDDLSAFFQRGR